MPIASRSTVKERRRLIGEIVHLYGTDSPSEIAQILEDRGHHIQARTVHNYLIDIRKSQDAWQRGLIRTVWREHQKRAYQFMVAAQRSISKLINDDSVKPHAKAQLANSLCMLIQTNINIYEAQDVYQSAAELEFDYERLKQKIKNQFGGLGEKIITEIENGEEETHEIEYPIAETK